MTKKELVAAIARRTGYSRDQSAVVLNATLDIIQETLETGEAVTVPKFGKFMVRQRKGREGRNPRSGDPITISPSHTVAFKAGTRLRAAVNPGRF